MIKVSDSYIGKAQFATYRNPSIQKPNNPICALISLIFYQIINRTLFIYCAKRVHREKCCPRNGQNCYWKLFPKRNSGCFQENAGLFDYKSSYLSKNVRFLDENININRWNMPAFLAKMTRTLHEKRPEFSWQLPAFFFGNILLEFWPFSEDSFFHVLIRGGKVVFKQCWRAYN